MSLRPLHPLWQSFLRWPRLHLLLCTLKGVCERAVLVAILGCLRGLARLGFVYYFQKGPTFSDFSSSSFKFCKNVHFYKASHFNNSFLSISIHTACDKCNMIGCLNISLFLNAYTLISPCTGLENRYGLHFCLQSFALFVCRAIACPACPTWDFSAGAPVISK